MSNKSNKNKGLGRGLSSLIADATAITDTMSMKGIVKIDEFTYDTQTLTTYKTSNKNYTNIEKRKIISK